MKVSIFIPTYNSSFLIAETLDSLLQQSYSDIEVLCVDDGSSDNTFDILSIYAQKDCRIKVFQKKNDGSVPFSWNYVFPYLQGDFTIYMSHDDLLESTAIEKLVNKQQTDPNIDCVIPSLVFFEKDMNFPEDSFSYNNKRNDMSKHPTISGEKAFDEMLDYSIPGFALWRTDLIRKIGMPTESFNSDEGMQRVWAKNCRKVAFSDARFGYRQSSKSIVKGLKPYHYFSLATNLRLFKEMVPLPSINVERKKSIQYKFYESLFYLYSCYIKNNRQFTTEQKDSFKRISNESYKLLSKHLPCPFSTKGCIMKLSAVCRPFFILLAKLK